MKSQPKYLSAQKEDSLNPNHNQKPHPTAELQPLADFINELNIARRSFSLYPLEHPQVASSNSKALQTLLKLHELREELTLGVSPETLFVDQQWLDKNNRVYNEFARFLFDLGVASISFKRGLVFTELLRFNQLLRGDRDSIEDAGGFPALLQMAQINHIKITPIDYSAFRARTGAGADSAGQKPLWEGFLQGLLSDSLDARGDSGDWPGHLDPSIVAEALNQRLADEIAGSDGYQRVVSTLVAKLIETDPEQDELPGRKLGSLLEQLEPKLRDSFLSSTLETLDQVPAAAEQVLENFPQELLTKTLNLQQSRQLHISNRLINLVGKLSTTPAPTAGYTQKPDPESLDEEVVLARLNILFNEENQDLYMPGSYQHALREILDKDQLNNLPEAEKLALKETLEQQSIERQCCAIIFELIDGHLSAESEIALQQNLLELSRFFLDTGDFTALREIYHRWSGYLNSNRAHATVFDETLLTNHTRLAFMVEVLDGVELWGKEKVAEISAYIAAVGDAYSEPLIERLGLEQQLSLRRIWMKLLEGIGISAHQAIIPGLKDKRWYLVRNLLIILGQQPELSSMKAIQHLTNHPHPKVRQEVLRILFRLNPATANRLLKKELSSHDPGARLAAVQLADLSRDPDVLSNLLQLLQAKLDSDSDLELKKQLLRTLARIGNPDSLPTLKQLLQKKGLLVSRRQKQFQREIIASLAEYPQQRAEPLLKELTRSGNRQQAKQATEMLQPSAGASL